MVRDSEGMRFVATVNVARRSSRGLPDENLPLFSRLLPLPEFVDGVACSCYSYKLEDQTMKKTFGLRKLTRHLLATSCLTVAAGSAHATTVNGPFGGSFGTATALPVGTTEITDSIPFNVGAVSEWVVFSGLQSGASFSFSGIETVSGRPPGSVSVRDSLNTDLLDFALPASGQPGTVPTDGKLFVDVQFQSCGDCGTTDFTLDLTAPLASSTPEPGTIATAGVALAGAVALRRKRK
jgi:hypothetical protein